MYHHRDFEPMQRHRPRFMTPHAMYNFQVDRPHRVQIEEARNRVTEDLATNMPYTPTTEFKEGNVKALLIGINYTGTDYALEGCVNDVHTMLDTLRKIDFPIHECVILVDDDTFPNVTAKPTRENIITYMAWLTKDCESGDVLFFHYSGHGAQIKSENDTQEEYDQCIIPLDYQEKGSILDDDLFEMLAKPCTAGVRMTCVFDCCHSATMLDLPFEFITGSAVTGENKTESEMKKIREDNFCAGDVVMFSGCEDDQTSADVANTSSFGEGETGPGGAATQAFTWALLNTKDLDYMNVLLQARSVLAEKKYTQVPQLTASKPIDLNERFSLFGDVTTKESQMQAFVPEEFRRPPPPHRGPHGRHGRRGEGQEGPRGFGPGPMARFMQMQQEQTRGMPMGGRGGRGEDFGEFGGRGGRGGGFGEFGGRGGRGGGFGEFGGRGGGRGEYY